MLPCFQLNCHLLTQRTIKFWGWKKRTIFTSISKDSYIFGRRICVCSVFGHLPIINYTSFELKRTTLFTIKKWKTAYSHFITIGFFPSWQSHDWHETWKFGSRITSNLLHLFLYFDFKIQWIKNFFNKNNARVLFWTKNNLKMEIFLTRIYNSQLTTIVKIWFSK
jgi:hypothetical protein